MTNKERVKTALKEKNIPQWILADYMGIREDSLSRIFRYELSVDKTVEMLDAIENLNKRRTGNNGTSQIPRARDR